MNEIIIRTCEVCCQDISDKKNAARFCSEKCARKSTTKKICNIEGCSKPVNGGGLCSTHYSRKIKGKDIFANGRSDTWGECLTHSLYQTWKGMRARCSNKNHASYHNYGGRGIYVCSRWDNFWNFVDDMGEKPTKEHSVERINNDGPYSKENCCWATRKEQRTNNRERTLSDNEISKVIELRNKKITRQEIAERLSIGKTTVARILKSSGNLFQKQAAQATEEIIIDILNSRKLGMKIKDIASKFNRSYGGITKILRNYS